MRITHYRVFMPLSGRDSLGFRVRWHHVHTLHRQNKTICCDWHFIRSQLGLSQLWNLSGNSRCVCRVCNSTSHQTTGISEKEEMCALTCRCNAQCERAGCVPLSGDTGTETKTRYEMSERAFVGTDWFLLSVCMAVLALKLLSDVWAFRWEIWVRRMSIWGRRGYWESWWIALWEVSFF